MGDRRLYGQGKEKRSSSRRSLRIICVIHLFMLILKLERRLTVYELPYLRKIARMPNDNMQATTITKRAFSSVTLPRGRLAPCLEQPRRKVFQIAPPCLPLVVGPG